VDPNGGELLFALLLLGRGARLIGAADIAWEMLTEVSR